MLMRQQGMNPRQGIETMSDLLFEIVCYESQQGMNPRQGIET